MLPELILASHGHSSRGSRSASMGGVAVCQQDIWSVYNNQALMAFQNKPGFGFEYENHFLLNEISHRCALGILPIRSGVFGAFVNYFGYTQYHETIAGIAFAKKFGNTFSAGISLDWLQTSIAEDYGSANNFTFETGVFVKLTDKLSTGIHVFNPLNIKLTDYNNERIPSVYNVGLIYYPLPQWILCCEIEKNLYLKANLKVGMEFAVAKGIFVRAGFSTNPSLYSFGFGTIYRQFTLDISASYHPVLGYSPQASIIYTFH